jgi:hypothetical protein
MVQLLYFISQLALSSVLSLELFSLVPPLVSHFIGRSGFRGIRRRREIR